jgi:predicted MFS family arabinose efflux permease
MDRAERAPALTAPTPDAATPADAAEQRRWKMLVASGVLATTLAQPGLLRLPFQHLLKSDLGVAPHEMAAFFAAAAIAWYFKPLAGLLSDSVPLFGTRRRHYLIVSGVAASLLWLVVAVVPRTYAIVLATVVLLNAALVMGSTVTGGVLVEAGQRFGATGRFTSLRYVVQSACLLIAGPLGGLLASRPFWEAGLFGAAVALSVVPVAVGLLHEPRAVRRTSGWMDARRELSNVMGARPLWRAVALMALLYGAPGFATALYYRQTDALGFRPEFIGTLAFVGGLLALGGAALYGRACRHLTLRRLLQIGIGCSAMATLGYVFYASTASAVVIEAQAGLFVTFAELALMDLAARAAPRGSEGLAFALMMSVRNGALALADMAGAWLLEEGWLSFPALVVLNAGIVAAAILAIRTVPAELLDRREGAE